VTCFQLNLLLRLSVDLVNGFTLELLCLSKPYEKF
jgi:hypothetical protein